MAIGDCLWCSFGATSMIVPNCFPLCHYHLFFFWLLTQMRCINFHSHLSYLFVSCQVLVLDSVVRNNLFFTIIMNFWMVCFKICFNSTGLSKICLNSTKMCLNSAGPDGLVFAELQKFREILILGNRLLSFSGRTLKIRMSGYLWRQRIPRWTMQIG